MIQAGWGSDQVVASSLRMPRSVRDDLKIQAIKAGRSYNTHVVMILTDALNEQDRQGGNPDGLKQS